MSKIRDITGERFGRLIAREYVGSRQVGRQSKRFWSCECSCGNVVERAQGALTTGNTRSCGCLEVDVHTTHGMTRTRVYSVWHAMITRCRSPNDPAYKDYGGRGISVCDQWKDFANFIADMGDRPPGGTLERIDVNGNYELSNCKWASQREQGNNRRNNRLLEFRGETRTLAEWAREVGLSKSAVIYRLGAGWPVDQTLTTPADRGTNSKNTKSRLLLQK